MIGQIGNDGTDNVDYATTIDRNGSVDGTGPFREGSSSGATFAGAGSFRCGEWRIFGGYGVRSCVFGVSGGEVGGPGDNYIKRGSWLMQDMEQVIRDAPPYAYPHDEWRWGPPYPVDVEDLTAKDLGLDLAQFMPAFFVPSKPRLLRRQ